MKYLLCRYGGIGDSITMTVVAKAIKSRDPQNTVHVAVREELLELFDDNPHIDAVLPLVRRPGFVDCLARDFGWVALDVVAPEYDMPIDFRFMVEGNTHYGHRSPLVGSWIESQNSNYQNWIDLSLAWANIDPETVADKTPDYRIKESERRWAREELSADTPTIAVNMTATSRTRTRSNSHDLVRPVLDAFPRHTVLWWNAEGKSWTKINRNGLEPFERTITLRESVALLAECDALVAMDSGLSHMAEAIASAIGLKTVCFYTTVPSWTRARYFPNCHAVDSDAPCSPCFNLHELCPENRKRVVEQLTDREKQIIDALRGQTPLWDACKRLGVTPPQLKVEGELVEKRMNSLAAVEPDCIRRITPERVVEQLRLLLNGSGPA